MERAFDRRAGCWLLAASQIFPSWPTMAGTAVAVPADRRMIRRDKNGRICGA